MATIDKLNYLDETKQQIKSALNDLGAGITTEDTFRSYVQKINDLSDEYPTQQQVTAFQTMQLNNIQTLEQPVNLQPLEPNVLDIQPLEQPQIIEEQPLEEFQIIEEKIDEEQQEELVEEEQEEIQEEQEVE